MTMQPDKSRTDRASLVARLGDVIPLDLTVTATAMVSPALWRIDLVGEDLVGLAVLPGQDLMVAVADGTGPRRRYSICNHDPALGTASLLIVDHDNGAGAQWTRSLQVGDVIDAVGPRGKQVVQASATTHLFIGEASSFGATQSMAESITEGTVLVVLAVADPDDALPLHLVAPATSIHMVEAAPGDAAPIVNELGEIDLSTEGLAVYVNAEFSVVRAVKSALMDRGIPEAAIATKAYWRQGRANAAHGEPPKD